MGKRGLGKGLGALFGEEVTKDETPVVKRTTKAAPKKSENKENSGEKTADAEAAKEPETIVVEKVVEKIVEKPVEVEKVVEKVVEKPVEQKLKISMIEPNSTQPRKKFDEEGLQETENKLVHIGRPIEMDDEWFRGMLVELDEATRREDDSIRKLVSSIVPTYRYQEEKESCNI